MSKDTSKSKSARFGGYGEDATGGGGGSSAAIPLLSQDADIDNGDDNSGERLPGYDDEGGDRPPEFEVYRPVVKKIKTKLGAGDTLTVSLDPHLNEDGEALYRWLVEENKKPPKVIVHISGHHTERRKDGKNTQTSTVTDFDLHIDATECLMELNGMGEPSLGLVDPGEKAHRGHGRLKSRARDLEDLGTVRDWADRYCEDQSTLKEFVMKKVVLGHDHEFLEPELKNLIRSTNYLGRISVSFPVMETRVEVYPPNQISRLRKSELCRWIFYLTFLWIFAWPYLWFMTKRYHVARSTWRMSMMVPNPEVPGETIRYCSIHEATWIAQWGVAIKRAAKARRQGPLSSHDLVEAIGQQERGVIRAPAPTGNSAVDGALGFIAGLGEIASDFRNATSEVVGWGGDCDAW